MYIYIYIYSHMYILDTDIGIRGDFTGICSHGYGG